MDIKERFLKYVSFHTTSDENSPSIPSTERQKDLGKFLADELMKIGMRDAQMDEYGYVYAYLPASKGMENENAIGFIAHMDTSDAASGENIRPQEILYQGGDIALSESEKISIDCFPFIEKYKGKHLIVADGTTLLGADDKAGIAEIVSACEYLIKHPEVKHRAVAICFTPDEEIGRGTDKFNFSLFRANYAYTVDGGEIGEIEYENFNGASATVTVHGVNIHPGSAKNKMKNAVLIANEFVSMMPKAETPSHTENYEGFYHVNHICGDENKVVIKMIIRDHSREKFESKKTFIKNLASYLNSVYGEGTVEAEVRDSYYNMKEKILPHMWLIDNAVNAMKEVGVEPLIIPIRGGTDGAMISYQGLPCPNLSTGGGNFHGVHEFVCTESMEKMTDIIVKLCK